MKCKAIIGTGLTILIGTALVGTPGLASASASASTTQHPMPYFVIWKPGTPLPNVPAGYHLMAWPPQQVLDHLNVGQTIPLVRMTTSNARSLRTNPAGLVNLELEPTKGGGCTSPQFQKDLGSRPANVMQSYSYINVTQTFTYGTGQSTGFSVGVSASGDYGTYTAGGHTSVSTTDSQGFDPQKGITENHFETYFEMGRYTEKCDNPATGQSWTNHLLMPYQWNAGTKYVHPSLIPAAPRCTPESHAGDNYTKHTTAAATFKAGYNIAGFTGTAQTGYSNTASIKFVFHQRGHLCGRYGTPPNRPGYLEATPW
jgi:hypothetical protein